jgi:uncharacterized protein
MSERDEERESGAAGSVDEREDELEGEPAESEEDGDDDFDGEGDDFDDDEDDEDDEDEDEDFDDEVDEASDRMKDLVHFITVKLVDVPDEVEIRDFEGERTTVLELRVHPDDLGKVIGRQGRTAQALRTLLSIAATRSQKKVVLEILE